MSGTRLEALSRRDVQSGIQRDLFAQVEQRMAMLAQREKAERKATHMRGMQYAPAGYQVPHRSHRFQSPLTRLVVYALVIVVGAPILGAFFFG